MQVDSKSELLSYKSPVITEEIAKYFNRSGKKKSLILPLYHWADEGFPLLKKSRIRDDKSFYVCDNSFEWNQSGMKGLNLYQLDCLIKDPLLLIAQFGNYELMFNEANRQKNAERMKDREYDTIVYTPHPLNQECSQICLLKPKEQILNIEHLGVME